MNNDLIRENRALAIIDRLTDSKVINIRERGILRRAILLPKKLQGEWGKHGECPFCSYIRQWEEDKFCGNCGADMRKGGAE